MLLSGAAETSDDASRIYGQSSKVGERRDGRVV